MKKKIFSLVLVLTAIFSLFTANLCYAESDSDTPLFEVAPAQAPVSKINLVGNLPQGEWQDIMASVIKLALAITGSLAFAAFTYGGVMMVSAQGQEEQIRKGKNILLWSVLALAIIAASYAIVIGLTQLKFFQ